MPCRRLVPLLAAIVLAALPAAAFAADAGLEAALKGPQRTPAMAARDGVRHPLDELEFFGLRPNQTVVEIWPAGGYWTEILAPYLHDRGTYYVALVPDGANPHITEANGAFRKKLAGDPATYGKVKLSVFSNERDEIAPPGSADLVVTFRNLHNWMDGNYADRAFADFYKALKPGGILGIEDHRGKPNKPQDPTASDGYVRQDYAVELAKKAGFEFVGASEINANPKDTGDWPKGVWTLPPTYALGDKDRAVYAAVGEADSFVLKFRKPMR